MSRLKWKGYAGFQITLSSSYSREKGVPLEIALTARGGVEPYDWSIIAEDLSIYSEDNSTINWVNNNAQTAGDYALTVRCIDADNKIREKSITVTVTSPPALVPGPLDSLSVVATSPTVAKVVVGAPLTGGAVVGYKWALPGTPAAILPANRRITLNAGTPADVSVWAYNNDGDGVKTTETVTMPTAGIPIVSETALGRMFDEVNRVTYTYSSAPVGAGDDDKQIAVICFSQSGTAHQHLNLRLAGSGVTATRLVNTGVALNHISIWSFPWAAGKPSTYDIAFDCKANDGTTDVTALRGAMEIVPIIGRSATIVTSGSDTSVDGNGELHNTIATLNEGELVLAAFSTTDNAVELMPDVFGVNINAGSTNSITSTTALQTAVGMFIAEDDTSNYDVGSEWVNEATGADHTSTLPRQCYVVFAAPTIAPSIGVQADWSDNFVEALGIGLHMDWGRANGQVATDIMAWPPGLSGAYGVLGSNNNPRCKNLPHMLGELGIRYMRSKWYDSRRAGIQRYDDLSEYLGQQGRYFEYLYKVKGMRMYGPCADESDSPTTIGDRAEDVITAFYKPNASPKYIPAYGIEGINESNEGYAAGWAEHTHACQKALYQKMSQLGVLGAMKCIMPSIWKRQLPGYNGLAAIGTTGDKIWDYCNVGCIHIYNGCREPTRMTEGEGGNANSPEEPVEQTFDEAQIINRDHPVMITETGHRIANACRTSGDRNSIKNFVQPYTVNGVQFEKAAWQSGGDWRTPYAYNFISWYSHMKYLPRMLLEYYTKGKTGSHPTTGRPYQIGTLPASITIYNFVDDVETRVDKCFGLTYPNKAENAIVAKPAYWSLMRLISLFKEKTWNATTRDWVGSQPALDRVNYTITGSTSRTGPRLYGQNQPGALFQKGSGASKKYYLVLFERWKCWTNPDAALPLPADITNIRTAGDFDNGETSNGSRRQMVIALGATFSQVNLYEPSFDNTGTYPANGSSGSDTTCTARATFSNVSSITVQVPDHPLVIELIP